MSLALATAERRHMSRDEVHYRARAYGPDARSVPLLIVNISAMGLMARCDHQLEEGARLRIALPVIGTVSAEVRWCLGGRVGCELDQPINLADYYELLAEMARAR